MKNKELKCKNPACRKVLRHDNKLGLCRDHRKWRKPVFCAKIGCNKKLSSQNKCGYCKPHRISSKKRMKDDSYDPIVLVSQEGKPVMSLSQPQKKKCPIRSLNIRCLSCNGFLTGDKELNLHLEICSTCKPRFECHKCNYHIRTIKGLNEHGEHVYCKDCFSLLDKSPYFKEKELQAYYNKFGITERMHLKYGHLKEVGRKTRGKH